MTQIREMSRTLLGIGLVAVIVDFLIEGTGRRSAIRKLCSLALTLCFMRALLAWLGRT